MPTLNLEQGSDEWIKARLGVCTASRFSDILPGRGAKYKVVRKTYLYELIAERLTGISKGFRATAEILHGQGYEIEAREAYSFISGNEVTETGITLLDENLFIGASPDGLVLPDGGIEIKCYDTNKHVKIICEGMPKELMPQVQGNIWLHNAKWWDFISYDPRIKSDKNIYIQRIERDQEYINMLKTECFKFTEKVQQTIDKIEG